MVTDLTAVKKYFFHLSCFVWDGNGFDIDTSDDISYSDDFQSLSVQDEDIQLTQNEARRNLFNALENIGPDKYSHERSYAFYNVQYVV